MAVVRHRLRISLALLVILLLGAAVTTVVLLRAEPTTAPVAEGRGVESTGTVARPPSSGPLRPAPPSAASSSTTARSSAVAPGGPSTAPTGVPADSVDAATITAFGRALVAATSSGYQAALSRLLCGRLAQELATQPVVADPTVYDRVTEIFVSPGGTAATATVYAYKVQRGPPARPLRLALQKSASGWQACSVING
ncbi:MAG: hypothetical protein ABI251_15895 [Mycobacteriaceae bacterium]